MAQNPGEREALERELERRIASQRWTVDGARIVVVFATGASASVGAAAWQSLGSTPLTVSAAIVLGLAVFCMIWSILADERYGSDIEGMVEYARTSGVPISELMYLNNLATVKYNESVLDSVVLASVVQTLAAVAAGITAAIAMLSGGG